jgi:hypothetical protein
LEEALDLSSDRLLNEWMNVSFNRMGHAVAASGSNKFIVILMMFIVHNLYSFTRNHP